MNASETTTKRITVVIVDPMERPRVENIEKSLAKYQSVVGGYIECVYPFYDERGIICNEEGKLMGLEPNRALYDDDGIEMVEFLDRDEGEHEAYDIISGTFIVVGLTEDDFRSLTDEEIKATMERFYGREMFLTDEDGKVAILRF